MEDTVKIWEMKNNTVYQDKNTGLRYKMVRGELYVEQPGLWVLSNIRFNDALGFDLVEVVEPPAEYTIAELAEMDLPGYTRIRSVVSKERSTVKIDPASKQPWIDSEESRGLYINEILGKWTIEKRGDE